MRKLALISVVFVLLVAVLGGGCRRGPGNAEARLIAIDTLSATAPDSALALLQDMDTTALSEADKAYHALLTTQSSVKAGVHVADFATIGRAWNYYKNHGPYDRHYRTVRYYGNVADRAGQPQEAIRWYKRAELAARDEGDSINASYALMVIGNLYKLNFLDSLAVVRFRECLSFLADARPDIKEFCYFQLSQLHQKTTGRKDSAAFYVEALKQLVQERNDSAMMPWAMLTETSLWFYDSCYTQSKDLAVANIRTFPDAIPYVGWTYAAKSFARLGMVDSAEYYLRAAPPPVNAADSSDYYYTMSLICAQKNDWQKAARYEVLSDSLAENLLFDSDRKQLYIAEKETEMAVEKERRHFPWLVVVGLVIVVGLLGYLAVNIYRRRLVEAQAKWLQDLVEQGQQRIGAIEVALSDRQREIHRLQDAINQGEQRIGAAEAALDDRQRDLADQRRKMEQMQMEQRDTEFLQSLYAQQSAALEDVIQSFGGMAKDFKVYGHDAGVFVKKFQKRMKNSLENNEFWSHIEQHINQTRHNALKHFFADHPDLNEKERQMVMLSVLGFNTDAIAVCLGYNNQKVAATIRSRLKKTLGIDGDIGAGVVAQYAEKE